jgi:ADP-ribose pyrophosphatase YjhB (NUDIX family)
MTSRSSGRPRPVREGGDAGRVSPAVEKSAGGVVVRWRDQRAHVLLILDPYRKWGLPKGHLEDGEGEEEAALREVREETGLSGLTLGPDLGQIDWTFRRAGRRVHKYCRFFLMHAPEGEARPQEDEGITECRWLSLDRAVRTVSYENARDVIRRARVHLEDTEGGDDLFPGD